MAKLFEVPSVRQRVSDIRDRGRSIITKLIQQIGTVVMMTAITKPAELSISGLMVVIRNSENK